MPVLPPDILSNSLRTSGVVTHTLLVEGEEVPSTVEVYSIDIWSELNRIPRAKVVILDGVTSEQTFKVSEKDWFVPGNEIEIQLGYQSEETTVFKGIVTGQSIKMRSNSNSILTVDCTDQAIKLTTIPKSRYFYNSTESEVFETIIGRYSNLTVDVETTEFRHKEILQFQSTDWDFIHSRADVNGLFCLVEGGIISIKAPDFGQEPVETVLYGNNLLEIDAEMDGTNQMGAVKGISWDYSKTEPSEVDAASTSPVTPGNISSTDLSERFENEEWSLRAGAKIPTEVLQTWANAKLMKHELAKIRGRAKIRGLSTIKPGAVITLEGVGDRFNGNAFVSGIKHSFYQGEWLMDVQFGLSPEWFSEQYNISENAAAGMLPSVSGLQIGLATAGAGNNRGVIVRPEIDDEVVVGFIHGDPNQPIILGTLNSANNPAPIAASDDNHEKGWISRGEIKMLLNDDAPSLIIEMPSGKKISVDDDAGEIVMEDENGNSMVMNSDGITVESPSDMNIKATGDLNLEGTNINVKANADFKAEGAASAEVSSSGSTTIKGSIVQIN